jgi:uncharacterized membrane protein YfcA
LLRCKACLDWCRDLRSDFSLGLAGGGGSILAVPLMVYVIGVPDAIWRSDSSVVAANAAFNLSNHARRRRAAVIIAVALYMLARNLPLF